MYRWQQLEVYNFFIFILECCCKFIINFSYASNWIEWIRFVVGFVALNSQFLVYLFLSLSIFFLIFVMMMGGGTVALFGYWKI